MTTFVFTDPSGKQHEVTGPDGSTKDQAFQVLQAQLAGKGAPATEPEPEPDTAAGMAWHEKALVGAGAAMTRVGHALSEPFVSDETKAARDDERAFMAKHLDKLGGAGTAGSIGADVLMSLAPMGVATKAAMAVKALRGAKALAATDVAANAAYGAATAPEDRGLAAALGGLGAVGGRVLTRALGGKGMKNERVAELLKNDVTPTIGQALRVSESIPGRVLARAEDTIADIPVIGAPVRAARDRAMKDWQDATRAATGVAGAKSTADVGRGLSKEYDTLISDLDRSHAAAGKAVDMSGLPWDAVQATKQAHNLTDAQFNVLMGTLKNTVEPRLAGESLKSMTPSTAHDIGVRLMKLAQRYKGAMDPRIADLGFAMEDVAQTWRGHMSKQFGPEAQQALGKLNERWSKYAPLRDVAKSGDLANPSEYTPKVLLQSIRRGDRSANKSGFIERGDLPQQKLAKAGQDVIGSPSGGTSPVEKAIGVGGFALGLYGNLPMTALVAGGAFAGYSKPVQRLLVNAAQNGTTVSRFLTEHPEFRSAIVQALAAQQTPQR